MDQPTKIQNICSYTLMTFLFVLPISTSASNILAILIMLLWVLDGNYRKKTKEIFENKVAVAVLLFLLLHAAGLLWTQDLPWGLSTLKKQWKLLLVPVIMNMALREHRMHYISAFLAAMFLSAIISYAIWLDLISPRTIRLEEGVRWFDTIGTFLTHDSGHSIGESPFPPRPMLQPYISPTPFSSHTVYTPLLAFASYIFIWRLWVSRRPTNRIIRWLSWSIFTAMCVNIFLTSGRVGHLVFFVLLFLGCSQFLIRSNTKSICLFTLLSLLILSTTYSFLPSFKERVLSTYNHIQNPTKTYNSISERIIFLKISSTIIQESPLFGVGTGDFPSEYKKRVETFYKDTPFSIPENISQNPHNQYLLVLTEFGIVGFLLLLAIFYQQIKTSLITSEEEELSYLRMAFPIFFLVIFLGDSYLQTSTTGLFFAAFSGILFKNYAPPLSNTIQQS